jgi:phytanoyl-CoA hydroxylase
VPAGRAPSEEHIVALLERVQAFGKPGPARASAPPANLWPLEASAREELDRRLQAGRLTRAEADAIEGFADKGYWVIERAIEPEVIDALVRDVRRIGEHPGCFLTTDHRAGRTYALSGPDFDTYESIFDTYVNLASARDVSLHPTITRFLELLFDESSIAFQQLLFQRSNQHPIHQDTSVVCVEEPLLMVATWVALEDVVPGRGELTYWEGSHKIPPYLFADGSRRATPGVDDAEASRAYLKAQCDQLGCKKLDFIARKGDLVCWAADLVHASNPRTLPEHETRMALVTHYCPRRARPFWMRFLPDHRFIQNVGTAAIASQYYRLPAEGLVRPTFEGPRETPPDTP